MKARVKPAAHHVTAHYADQGEDQTHAEGLPTGYMEAVQRQDPHVCHPVDGKADGDVEQHLNEGAKARLVHVTAPV